MKAFGYGFGFVFRGNKIDSQAQSHFNRVIADGGIIPAGLVGLNYLVQLIKAANSTTDITSVLTMGYNPHYFGYKLGAGSGTTLGMAAQKLYSICGATSDLTQATAANQPLLLSHTGVNYAFLPRVSGNYFSSPYNASISLRGNFDIKAEIKTTLSSSQQDIFSNANTSNGKLIFRLNSSNGLRLLLSINGTDYFTYDSTANIGTITNKQWVRVTRNSTSGVLQFFTSPDGTTWTQLGSNVSGATGDLFNGNSVYEVGSNFLGTSANLFQGLIYRVLVSQTINGSAVLDFNPASYAPSVSQTTFTTPTSEVWTMNIGSASTGYKVVLVNNTFVQFDATNDQMSQTAVNRPNTLTQYVVFNAYANTGGGGGQIIDSTNVNYSNSLDPENNTTIAYLMNGAASTRNRTKNIRTLDLVTAWSEAGVENGLSVDNGTASTNTNTLTPSNTGVRIGARANAAAFSNMLLSTYLVSNSRNSSTIRTSMYNIIREITNNAF